MAHKERGVDQLAGKTTAVPYGGKGRPISREDNKRAVWW